MGLVEDILKYLDDGETTLVFPTENAARHFLSLYVRKRRKSVLSDRAIAFDSFKEKFAPVHERKPAGKYHRLAFVSSFLSCGNTGLKYLYDDAFSTIRRRFIPFLTRILPDLMQLEQVSVRSKALYSDLQILRRQYGSFLEKKQLFEPGWEKHSLQYYKGQPLNHVLVGFDADIQMQKLMAELGDVPEIGRLEMNCIRRPVYSLYSTEEAELDALFQHLHALKLKGVPTSEIVVSTPALSSLGQRLERKALEYNVPLSFMGSVDIFQTVPGRYLSCIMQCITERLSFRSLEAFLLNTSFPYKNMEDNRTFVRFMIDNNVLGGSLETGGDDPLYHALRRCRQDRALDFYLALRGALNSIRRASDANRLSQSLHQMSSLLFGAGEFNDSADEDRDVYSFVLSELSELGKTLSDMDLDMDDMFSIFMDELQHLSYVPQDERSEIRVFRYGQDPLLYVPYHFVVGLNDANSQVKESTLGFLEDHEISSRTTFDVTQRLFEYYGSSGDNVLISGSSETFEGAAGAPTYFILNDSVKEAQPDDMCLFDKADAVSLNQASDTSFAPSGGDLAKEGQGMGKDPDARPISYSSISSYARCPYMAFVESELLEDSPDRFEPADQDDREIGSLLHKVIQRFMGNHLNQLVVPEKLDEYHKEVEEIMDSLLENESAFDPYMKESIRGNYLDSLKNVLNILLLPPENSRTKGYVGPFKPVRNEYPLKNNPSFVGYIDTILMDISGKIHLLDYKKGTADPTYQLVLYRRLYEENPEFGSDVGECLFYSMASASFRGFDKAKWEEQEKKLDDDIGNLRSGFASGRWNATPSKQSCSLCEDRAICRRRFNLQ